MMPVGTATEELVGVEAPPRDAAAERARAEAWDERKTRAIILLAMALPVMSIMMLPLGSAAAALMWMLGVAVTVPGVVRLVAGRERDPRYAVHADARMLASGEVPAPVADAMDVRIATAKNGVWEFRGPLKDDPDRVAERLSGAIPPVVMVRLEADADLGATIRIEPRATRAPSIARRLARGVFAVALLALTVITTAFFGALGRGANAFEDPTQLALGLPYSAALLIVGIAHALTRAIVAKRHAVAFSPPYFVPLPFPPGTLGTVMRSGAPRDRRALFDHAAAGAVVALVVCGALLFFALKSSPVVLDREGLETPGVSVGSSMMLALLAKLSIPEALTYGDHVLFTPIAVAAWLAMLLTALHLLPVGALDGGKMLRAMLGSRAGSTVATVARWGTVALVGLTRPAWLPLLLIVFLVTRRTHVPLDDLTPLPPGRWLVGCAAFLALGLIVTPLPHPLWDVAGIRCHEHTKAEHAEEAQAALRTIGIRFGAPR